MLLLTTRVVHSNLIIAASAVYLLKLSGEGEVGGNNAARKANGAGSPYR